MGEHADIELQRVLDGDCEWTWDLEDWEDYHRAVSMRAGYAAPRPRGPAAAARQA